MLKVSLKIIWSLKYWMFSSNRQSFVSWTHAREKENYINILWRQYFSCYSLLILHFYANYALKEQKLIMPKLIHVCLIKLRNQTKYLKDIFRIYIHCTFKMIITYCACNVNVKVHFQTTYTCTCCISELYVTYKLS